MGSLLELVQGLTYRLTDSSEVLKENAAPPAFLQPRRGGAECERSPPSPSPVAGERSVKTRRHCSFVGMTDGNPTAAYPQPRRGGAPAPVQKPFGPAPAWQTMDIPSQSLCNAFVAILARAKDAFTFRPFLIATCVAPFRRKSNGPKCAAHTRTKSQAGNTARQRQ